MSDKQATEHFAFEPRGPYCILASVSGDPNASWEVLEAEIMVKRKAISQAKKYLDHGTFRVVAIHDTLDQIIFQEEKKISESFYKTTRIMALLKLLKRNSELPQELRNQICILLSQDTQMLLTSTSGEAWDEVEDEALKILLVTIGVQEVKIIARLLDRSESAVTHRIQRLQLVPRPSTRAKLF